MYWLNKINTFYFLDKLNTAISDAKPIIKTSTYNNENKYYSDDQQLLTNLCSELHVENQKDIPYNSDQKNVFDNNGIMNKPETHSIRHVQIHNSQSTIENHQEANSLFKNNKNSNLERQNQNGDARFLNGSRSSCSDNVSKTFKIFIINLDMYSSYIVNCLFIDTLIKTFKCVFKIKLIKNIKYK